MANIKIFELRPAGSELFQDSESFLNELNDQATSDVFGGGYIGVIRPKKQLQQLDWRKLFPNYEN